jgi:hypothetical protein
MIDRETAQARCETFRTGRCNGVQRTVCGACGVYGHGNCYGGFFVSGSRGQIQVPCNNDTCEGAGVTNDDIRATVCADCLAKLEALWS